MHPLINVETGNSITDLSKTLAIIDKDNMNSNVPIERVHYGLNRGECNINDTFVPFDEESVKSWLKEDCANWKLSELKELMKYTISLAESDTSHIRRVVFSAMCRVGTGLAFRDMDDSEIFEVLRFGYVSCFKSLMYLENYNIGFDVDLVVDIVQWQYAYQAVSLLSLNYQLRSNKKIHSVIHQLFAYEPMIISGALTNAVIMDLKNIAHQRGPWARSAVNKNRNLPGHKLQHTDEIVAAEAFIKNSNVQLDDIDDRVPDTPYSVEQDLIITIMSAVSAVDKQFGVSRPTSEWEDLRESLAAFGVCDEDGDVYTNDGILTSEDAYGLYSQCFLDKLCIIGFNSTVFRCLEKRKRKFPEQHMVKHIFQYGSHTIKLEYEDGNEDFLGFFDDVSQVNMSMNATHVVIHETSCSIEYDFTSGIDEREERTLNEISMEMANKVIVGEVSQPYPSPGGIETIGFCLCRHWKTWRGVNIVDGAVAVVAFNNLRNYLDIVDMARNVRVDSSWNGYIIDFEVIALALKIRLKPVSFVLLPYLAHIATYGKFKWEHISCSTAIQLGASDLAVCFNDEDVERFISLESLNSQSLMKISATERLRVRDGYVVVNCRRPWDLVVLCSVLFAFCVAPALTRSVSNWNDGLSEAIQNLGTGVAPIIILYSLARYQEWDVRNMMKGHRKC